jgi:ketosteroid isomerase-like protein
MKITTTPIASSLPVAVARFVEAANRCDASAAANCFTADASVHDENQDFDGRSAIRAWVAATGRKYRPAFTVMRASVNGDDVDLAVAVSGEFPGSPVTLDYLLRLRDGKISELTIE